MSDLTFPPVSKLSQSRPKPDSIREEHMASATAAMSRFNAIGNEIMSLEEAMARAIAFRRGIRSVVTARKPL
jgi:hypothetical protein